MMLLLSRNIILLVVMLILCIILVNVVKHYVVRLIKREGENSSRHFVLKLSLQGSSYSQFNVNPLFVVVFLILVIKNKLRRNIVVEQFLLKQLVVLFKHIINHLYFLVINFVQRMCLNKKLSNMVFVFKTIMEIMVFYLQYLEEDCKLKNHHTNLCGVGSQNQN